MEDHVTKTINAHKNEMQNRDRSNMTDAITKAKFLTGECCAKMQKAQPKWVVVSNEDGGDESSIATELSNSKVAWSVMMRS